MTCNVTLPLYVTTESKIETDRLYTTQYNNNNMIMD